MGWSKEHRSQPGKFFGELWLPIIKAGGQYEQQMNNDNNGIYNKEKYLWTHNNINNWINKRKVFLIEESNK